MQPNAFLFILALAASVDALCPHAKRAMALQYAAPEAPALTEREKTTSSIQKRQTGFAGLPFTTFNENQEIDVTGDHKWIAPGPTDQRGPCPALNALANHGYYPRSGVVSFEQGFTAPQQVYGLDPSFGSVLSLYGTLVEGDPLTLSWSIGSPPTKPGLTLLGKGSGLSGSHNTYEGDASPTRGDSYTSNGDVSHVRVETFQKMYDLAKDDPVPNFDLDKIIQHRKYTFDLSVSNNPYFFLPPFPSLVSTIGHTFIPGLMSNHSADHPNGILDRDTLKSFFSITEAPDGSLSYTPGWERIPDNWYRRPLGPANEYGLVNTGIDLLKMSRTVPGIFNVGGNTGTVNSFVGLDFSNVTGGAYNSADLLDPQKFTCFFFQLFQSTVPAILRGRSVVGAVLQTSLNLIMSKITPLIDPSCPAPIVFDGRALSRFPGSRL